MPKIFIESIKARLARGGNDCLWASGLLWGLACLGFGLWPLGWIALVPACFYLRQVVSDRVAFTAGFRVGAVAHGVMLIWLLGLFPLRWMGMPDIVSALIALGGWTISLTQQGLWVGLIFMVWRRLIQASPWALLIGGPIIWFALLWGLNQQPMGLPWGFLSYSQAAFDPVRQSLASLHFWGLEILLVLANLSLFYACSEKRPRLLAVPLTVFLGVCVCGLLVKPLDSTVFERAHPIVVQGNLGIESLRQQLTPMERVHYYERLMGHLPYSWRQATQILILPEGVSLVTNIHRPASVFRHPGGIAILSGGIFIDEGKVYNGSMLMHPVARPQTTAKRFLVPFGETTPFVSSELINDLLKPFGVAYGRGFDAGSRYQPMLTTSFMRMSPLICFEALYPDLALEAKAQGTEVLVTHANLSWFHQNSLIERQFLAVNQLRAAESGLPLILAANTGVSAFIDATGKVLTQTPSSQTAFLSPSQVKVLPGFKPNKIYYTPLKTQFMDY